MKIRKCVSVVGVGLVLAAGMARAESHVSWSVSVGSTVPSRSYYPSYCPGTGLAVGVVHGWAPVYYTNAYVGQPVVYAPAAPVVLMPPPPPQVIYAPAPVVYSQPAVAVGVDFGAVELSFGVRDWHRAPVYCPPPVYGWPVGRGYYGGGRWPGHDHHRDGGGDRHGGGDSRRDGRSHR